MKTSPSLDKLARPLILSALLVACINPAHADTSAKPTKRAPTDTAQTSSTSSSDWRSGSTFAPKRYGIGFSTPSKITENTSAVTGWVDICPRWFLQPYVTVPSTSPFQLAGGAIVKYTLIENNAGTAGFHLGFGPTFGDLAQGNGHVFSFSMSGVVGFHVQFPGASNIMLQLDGGPTYALIDGNDNLSVNALSSALGLSVIYIF
jgi:hypothetical protein